MKIIITVTAILSIAGILFINEEHASHNDALHSHPHSPLVAMQSDTVPTFPYQKTEAEWKEILTSSQYRILRKKGTEIPYINEYFDFKGDGIYVCAGCGQHLYDSDHKYKSGTGWPSFWKPIDDSLVVELEDRSFFMVRTEIVCSNCGGHLGHVFDDGPQPTGLRYCMNSAAMKFVARDEISEQDSK
ncbi:MAG: peptide-methionine (R)-S-oxide reductase MsrB [Balneolaceae bacterium]|nr:peptide-methionine (R)-S-oxide reductase MsrB [Balneolaceae bacterium]